MTNDQVTPRPEPADMNRLPATELAVLNEFLDFHRTQQSGCESIDSQTGD